MKHSRPERGARVEHVAQPADRPPKEVAFGKAVHPLGRLVDQLGVRTTGVEQEVTNLSGGNQQKVVIAKWLATRPRILILDEPTRGIDVAAKAEVHALMSRLARDGVSILMISSELPEILGMSDRILVMRQGRLTGEFTREQASQEAILACAA